MGKVVGKLTHLQLPCVENNAKPFFKDVYDHVHRVENMVTGLREIVTSVFEGVEPAVNSIGRAGSAASLRHGRGFLRCQQPSQEYTG